MLLKDVSAQSLLVIYMWLMYLRDANRETIKLKKRPLNMVTQIESIAFRHD